MKINSPAKINLFLHITGKRPNGYHDIHSLMCGIALYDTLTLDFEASKITVSCTHSAVPEDETNIAYRAAECFFDALGHSGGVGINIEKRIPVAAGLGGGSSNAASVLSGSEHPLRSSLFKSGPGIPGLVPWGGCAVFYPSKACPGNRGRGEP